MAVVLADIGGTNARFALAAADSIGTPSELARTTYPTRAHASLSEAVRTFLSDTHQSQVEAIYAAVAGPVVAGRAQMTNSPWQVCAAQLAADFDTASIAVLNDFEALAYALPLLTERDLTQLGDCGHPPGGNRRVFAVVGPGTGLGAAGLIMAEGRPVPIVTEGGHVGFAPETAEQMHIKTKLESRYDRVSAERLASGQGIENIYWALSDRSLSAAEIFQRCRADEDAHAVSAVRVFFRVLGQVAGDLALAMGSLHGVYIAGGVAQKHGDLLLKSEFREGFESKGRHRALMRDTPTFLVTHPEPGLLGAWGAGTSR